MESDKVYNVTVEESGNIAVTVSTIATVEVSENAVNIGGGAEVYKGLVGADVQFRTIENTDGDITITQTGDTIQIELDSNITADLVGNSTGTHFGDVVGGDLSVNDITSTGLLTTGNVVPSINNHFTLGTPDKVWKDIYIGDASLYIDGHKVLGSDPAGDIDITTDPGQNLNVQAGGDLYFNPGSQTINIDATDINLGPSTGGTIAEVTGTLNATTSLTTDALEITGTKIDQTGGQSLEIKTGPAAYIHQNTSDVYVGSFTQAAHITPTSIGAIGNALNITGNFTGDVLGTATQAQNLDNHTSDDLFEGATNQYYTDAKVDARIPTNVSAFTNDSGYITSASLNGYALESYVDQEISNLIAAAPTTLDTLNELAAALNDDPNFATTITNQIGNKLDTSAFTSTADTWLATKTTTNLAEGTNLYYTDTRFDTRFDTKTTDDLDEGTSNQYYTDARARNAVSLSTTNNSELSYDPLTGVFSYVSPTTVTAANAIEQEVLNNTGATLAKGAAVYISGHTGSDITVSLAQNDVAGQYPAIGLVSGAINNNTNGFITVTGELAGINTSGFNVGDVLYLSSTPGVLTNVRPSSAAHAVQNIGKVARSHPSDGIIIISGSGRANDVPNLDHLEVFIGDTVGYQKRQLDASDLSDIDNTNPSAGDVLTWDAVNLQYSPQAPTGGGGGIELADLSVTQNAAGTAALTYDNTTGVFSYTPPDLSGYISSLASTTSNIIAPVAFAFVDTTSNGSGVGISWSNWNATNYTLDFTFATAQPNTDYAVITDSETFDDYFVGISNKTTTGFTAEFYDDTQSRTPSSFAPFIFQIFGSSPTQTIYGSGSLTDLSVTQLTPSGGGSLTYNSTTGVFSYTAPDLSAYLQSETDTLQTVTNRDAATTNTCVVPFYYQDQAAFPNATTYHGAMAHSHTDGAMYFAHASAWVELSNKADVDTALGDIDTALTTILGS